MQQWPQPWGLQTGRRKPLLLRLRTPVSSQILKSGKSNVYIINSQGMAGERGARFAAFNSEIVLAEQEQIVPVDKLIGGRQGVGNGSATGAGERFLVGNEDTPPPDQLEMHLP